jgi:AGZA family xanthine/uracil permease-like MFS transporter
MDKATAFFKELSHALSHFLQKALAILVNPSVFFKSPGYLRFVIRLRPHTFPWFVRGDLDGFFGLFIDNLLQLMLIGSLCKFFCGFPTEFITGQILPGAAISILLGNVFYAWQARQLAIDSRRGDVTALPFGINTPSLIAFIILIMNPIYQETHDSHLAWQAGLFACFLNGLMEIGGAYAGDWLRQNTPRAALLCALAGVAITFIAMGFIFQIFSSPLIGLLPMMLILISYGARIRWPLSLPGGFLAVVIGTLLAWTFRSINLTTLNISTDPIVWGFHPPHAVPRDLFALFLHSTGWKYLAVIFPMGLFNVIGSLQNLESAEAAGDRYPTRPSLLTNGIATLAAAFFGSPFPTTIYIGHPGWKAMGARHGYSILNGAIITILCLGGGVTLFLKVVPPECILGILLWIAIIITAQAFQEIPKEHSLAVAFGLIPAFAAFALEVVMKQTLLAANVPLSKVAAALDDPSNPVHLHGLIALSQGFLLVSMIFAAMMAFIIDRKFLKAAQWCLAASLLSFTGFIHAYRLPVDSFWIQNKFGIIAAPEFGIMYLLTFAILLVLHFQQKSNAKPSRRKKKGKKDEFAEPPKSKVGYL